MLSLVLLRGTPQVRQKLACDGLSRWHREHFMRGPPLRPDAQLISLAGSLGGSRVPVKGRSVVLKRDMPEETCLAPSSACAGHCRPPTSTATGGGQTGR